MLESLNEEQRNALSTLDGAVLVTAGAGSGKTRLLTHRIAHLIIDKGVKPYNILAITFTNKAANEMKERICTMVDEGNQVWISTIHSMCVKILRNEIESLYEGYTRYFTIYSPDDCTKELKKIAKEMGYQSDEIERIVKDCSFNLSSMKNENMGLQEYAELNAAYPDMEDMVKIMAKYQERLKQSNALDFDDLMVVTMNVFQNKEILRRYSSRFHYIHVDEFQDTNTIQYDLVKALSSVHGNVFVVGDEDQCIYGWRGAKIKNIASFIKEFENCKVYKLEQNYRSTKNILDTANKLIENNCERIKKTLWTDNSNGEQVLCKRFNSDRDEADFVAKTIYELVNYQSYKKKDIAILMRLNALSRSIEEKLLSLNLPHRVFGGFKFFDRQEIKNVIAYLRLAINQNDSASFNRVINFPKRAIGQSTNDALSALASAYNLTEFSAIDIVTSQYLSKSAIDKLTAFKTLIYDLKDKSESLPIPDFIAYVIDKTGIKAEYEKNIDENRDRLLNVNQLTQSASEFLNANPDTKLFDYLESISLISDIDDMTDDDKVTIATVHSVKGLEFKVVFIIGAEDKVFPIKRLDGSDDIEEERRLMYVAITRAKERLYISYTTSRFMYGKITPMLPSEFLKECNILTNKKENSYQSAYGKLYNNGYGSEREDNFSSRHISPSITFGNSDIVLNKINSTKYTIGSRVSHPSFGEGVITAVAGTKNDVLTIKFDRIGNKQLLTEFAPLTII